MGKVWNQFTPAMLKCCVTSGAASNATFAVADADGTAIAATDEVYEVLVFDGNTGVIKSMISRANLTVTAGAAKTGTVATGDDTVAIRWISSAAG